MQLIARFVVDGSEDVAAAFYPVKSNFSKSWIANSKWTMDDGISRDSMKPCRDLCSFIRYGPNSSINRWVWTPDEQDNENTL